MRKHTFILSCVGLFFGFFSNTFAQVGCTDMQALNFDAAATENDGSCIYPMTSYAPNLLTELHDDNEEISGMTIVESDLWALNDSGNPNKLYRIDTLSGAILQEVDITNAGNEDWEDLAQSEDFLFIGDFGNNAGNRTNLRIYKIAKSDLENDEILAEIIFFSYEDQFDFAENNNNHNFDCEAFFFHNNSLHLFTKNWVDNQTKHYTLPAEVGEHQAQLQATFDTQGLITGAAIAPDSTVALVGYTSAGIPFMWLLFDYLSGDYFSGNKRRIELGSPITISQLESVAFQRNGYGYLASESFSFLAPKLFSFSSDQWTNPITSTSNTLYHEASITLSPNPIDAVLTIQFKHPVSGTIQTRIINTMGQTVLSRQRSLSGADILAIDALENLPAGNYWLEIQTEKKRFVETFVK